MSIRFDEARKLFILEGNHSAYQMKIDEIGVLEHVYFGAKVGDTDMSYRNQYQDMIFWGNPFEADAYRGCSLGLTPQEYSGCGVGDYRVNSIGTVLANGSRSCDLRYHSHTIRKGKYELRGLPSVRMNQDEMETLEIILADPVIGLQVKLLYSVLEEKDVITRSAVIQNVGKEDIRLEKAASACIDFPYGDLDLIQFQGRACMERQPERVRVTHDIHAIGTKRGMSSHQHNPFTILCDHTATENSGDCYGFMLMYSGNHKTEIEKDEIGSVRLVTGISEDHFSWKLCPEEEFYTPEVILSYSGKGLNGLSGNYHRTIRENVCDRKYMDMKRPVLINNWEATYFDFDTDKIIRLAKQAQELGIEMLVLDDGWFGNRVNDRAGLGDWFVNEEKLPGGLKKITDAVNALGMKFGLWFEPEMINEDTKLYREHPDWALRDPDRFSMLSRNQMVLDMSRKDVQDYLYDCISKILDSANIEYIKWDFNRPVSNVYSNLLPADRQGEASHRFVLGTYSLMERLTRNYPHVMIEGCAGGGGRFDAGILYYSPQIWCSDDTDPVARLKIQKGTSYGYPVSTMGAHVSASPNHQTGRETTLETRGIVAMSGTFGYELDLTRLTEAEKEEIREQIRTFHKYYWLLQKGTYYRLTDEVQETYYNAWEMVSEAKDEALLNLVVTDVHGNPEFPFVRLQGLKPDSLYLLEGTDKCFSGLALMNGGFSFGAMRGVYPCKQLHFVELNRTDNESAAKVI